MLNITIPSIELWDEKDQVFRTSPEYKLQLEHSLVSLSKWESKWKKPFLTSKDKSTGETIDYIRCMTITQNVDPIAYSFIGKEVMQKVTEYIDDSMTATTFSQPKDKPTNKEIITAEIIYYWLVTFQINWEAQKWHLNRLLALINVCSIKNQPKTKMGRKEAQRTQRELNASRKSKLNTSG